MGTNGWYDTDTGNTLSILVRAKDFNVVLDAGMKSMKRAQSGSSISSTLFPAMAARSSARASPSPIVSA